MKKNSITPIGILWLFILISLFCKCGSEEAIKAYGYPITKYELEKAVMKVIQNNPNIYLYTGDLVEKGHPPFAADTANYTIHTSAYSGEVLWIKIKVGKIENGYTFRYYGDSSDWKNSPTSQIFIISAHNSSDQYLRQGYNEHGEFSSKLAKDLTELFETELVDKIDKELHLKHVVKHANED